MTTVIKRNGTKEEFSWEKVERAAQLAANAIKVPLSDEELHQIRFEIPDEIDVEDVLDLTIKKLYELELPAVADSFAFYRERRRKERDVLKKLMTSLEKISVKDAKDVDLKRENANIDGDTAMGQMLRFGSESAKAFYLSRIIDPEFADAHISGDIHIHDLDFYSMTTTCLQIDLGKLFKTGFDTGHGFIRPPKSIKTACNLACVVIQSNQNEQHGGQSIPNFDRMLAPHVDVSLRDYYREEIEEKLRSLADTSNSSQSDVAETYRDAIRSVKYDWLVYSEREFSDVLNDARFKYARDSTEDFNAIRKVVDEYELLGDSDDSLTNEGIDAIICDWRAFAYDRAKRRVEKETLQGMEALVHNLNTMHSRNGAQVPFSSINFGTDTSDAGRLVALSLLQAQENGLGKGETPIFPILIYRLKDGINVKKRDPNYDVFRRALECSSKRMFPNFSFQDATFNLQYYDPQRPETEIAYMGALSGGLPIRIKCDEYEGPFSLKDFWEWMESKCEQKGTAPTNIGATQYIDVEGVSVLDRGNYVPIKRVVRSIDLGNWFELEYEFENDDYWTSSGLYCTADHPWPVKGKGRVEAKDIKPFDRIESCDGKNTALVKRITPKGWFNEYSYDIETESDRFDVLELSSHNCRTRVIGNVYDPSREISYSRGNLSFTTVNLPRLAYRFRQEHKEREFSDLYNAAYARADSPRRPINDEGLEVFLEDYLHPMLDLARRQLLERFALQSARTVKNFPFLMGQGAWLDSEKLGKNDKIGEVLKHGTLSIGFIGLAETLRLLVGAHHGESPVAQKIGLKIIRYMRDFCDEAARNAKLNFTLLATPSEGLCARALRLDRKKFGVVPGYTDKEYLTNSFHVPVEYDITAARKIEIEAPYHALTNAGHISYVELDGDAARNVDAMEKIVLYMKEKNMGYAAINHPIDYDEVCGYRGVIYGDKCPKCGRKETPAEPFTRIRRITGYLVGGLDRFNDGKRDEERRRVKHGASSLASDDDED